MPRFLLSLAAAALVLAAALAETAPATTSSLRPETLSRTADIRSQVTARYAQLPGRKLAVTEATTTADVGSLTLVTESALRVVPADNGIYFSICIGRARCPYPPAAASWPATASLPRQQALELALRTFLETSADLVVVSLPTLEPVWVVFEREDLLATVDEQAVLARVTALRVRTAQRRELVDRITRPRLFVPLPVIPPPPDTMYAASLSS